eukprot:TRINITY_DN13146_c0_g1_i1.p1 TRINITY_DN13146_c0_g1~~TRINITY_DN13146_c0_g1_i1.p1  ORF type:complete len:504 (-),score=122.90 TRINITY_DN13146_c0_g1_i1:248-1759(-)
MPELPGLKARDAAEAARPPSAAGSPSMASRTTATNAWMPPEDKGTTDEGRATRWTGGKLPEEDATSAGGADVARQASTEEAAGGGGEMEEGDEFLQEMLDGETSAVDNPLEEWLQFPTPRTNPQCPPAGKLLEYMQSKPRTAMTFPPQGKKVREDCIQYFAECRMEPPKQRHNSSTATVRSTASGKSAKSGQTLDEGRPGSSSSGSSSVPPGGGSRPCSAATLEGPVSMQKRFSSKSAATSQKTHSGNKASLFSDAHGSSSAFDGGLGGGLRLPTDYEVDLRSKAFKNKRWDVVYQKGLKTDEDLGDLNIFHGAYSRSMHSLNAVDPSSTSKTLQSLTQLLRRQLNPQDGHAAQASPSGQGRKSERRRKTSCSTTATAPWDAGDAGLARCVSRRTSLVSSSAATATAQRSSCGGGGSRGGGARGRQSSSVGSLVAADDAWEDIACDDDTMQQPAPGRGCGRRSYHSRARDLSRLARRAVGCHPQELQKLADLAQVSMVTVTRQ